MTGTTKDTLLAIVSAVCRSGKFSMSLNQAKVHREIARRLKIIDGQDRTQGFIANMLRGDHGAGKETEVAISKLYKNLVKPKKPKPTRRRRYLEIDCTDEELEKMQKNSLRKRAEIQLGMA